MTFWKNMLLGSIVCICLCYGLNGIYAANPTAQLNLEIKGSGIRHGTPNNVNLGTPTTSSTDQEISGPFDGYFRVEDLQGDMTGHYTTIQCDGVYGSAGNRLTGVYLKAGTATPVRLLGVTGNVHINPALQDYVSIITPVTYLYKPTDSAYIGYINKYGNIPRLKIFIPGGTPPGTYSGTIVFSLYTY